MDGNFLNNNPFNDKDDKWRKWLAVFTAGLCLGAFYLSNFDLPEENEILVKKIIKPLEITVSQLNRGGDVQVAPPAEATPKFPELKSTMLDSGKFSAGSIFAKDVKTGAVLFHKNEYSARPVASLTKLMSALIILENRPNWSVTTTVIGEDSLDTHMYAGDVYPLEDLWQAALIGSSNKAILSLVSALGLDKNVFVERMNQRAHELGMMETVFTDPSGLDETNVSSASDLALLLQEALQKKRIQTALITKEYNLYSVQRNANHHFWSTNWLLLGWIPNQLPEMRGGKTGYIPASGYNFIMQAGDGQGHFVNVIILGANSHEARFTEARDVAEWVFASYEWPE